MTEEERDQRKFLVPEICAKIMNMKDQKQTVGSKEEIRGRGFKCLKGGRDQERR